MKKRCLSSAQEAAKKRRQAEALRVGEHSFEYVGGIFRCKRCPVQMRVISKKIHDVVEFREDEKGEWRHVRIRCTGVLNVVVS